MARGMSSGALIAALAVHLRCPAAMTTRASVPFESSEFGLWGRHGTWEPLPLEESSAPTAAHSSRADLTRAKIDPNPSEMTCGAVTGHETSHLDDAATKQLLPVFFKLGMDVDTPKKLSEFGLWGRHGTWEPFPFEESSVPAIPHASLAALSCAKIDANASVSSCGADGHLEMSQFEDAATKQLRPVFFKLAMDVDTPKKLHPVSFQLGMDVDEGALAAKELRPVSFALGEDFGGRKLALL